MTIVLFEDEGFVDLLPLACWRTVFELLVGRKILMDRISQRLGVTIGGVWVRDWMVDVARQRCGAPANEPLAKPCTLVNGRWLVEDRLKFPPSPCVGVIGENEIAYINCDVQLAAKLSALDMLSSDRRRDALAGVPRVDAPGHLLRYPWDAIRRLPELLLADCEDADPSIESPLDPRTVVDGRQALRVGERVRIHPTAVIDANTGPVFIGDDVTVGAYAVLEGPLYLGPGSKVSPHAWLHGGNAIGPVCKVGGEVTGCIMHGYSNKQHDGFLGHAYVGSWVNIGAGAVNSNLKNTYTHVSVPINARPIDSGQLFFGAVIGDHAKIGINSTLPTGAVVGFAASVAGTAMLPKFIPSFSWVNGEQIRRGDHLKALDTAATVMARRNVEMTDEEVELFLGLHDRLGQYETRNL